VNSFVLLQALCSRYLADSNHSYTLRTLATFCLSQLASRRLRAYPAFASQRLGAFALWASSHFVAALGHLRLKLISNFVRLLGSHSFFDSTVAMAETTPSSSTASLPPLPQTSAAPGQQDYGPPTTNGQGNPAHMPPPPLPPVVIPQNTNPIPTAVTSPFSTSSGMMSPGSAGGSVRRAAPEPNKRALYVGGLDPRVTEEVLRQIFETTGHVQNVKIIPDKNVGAVSIKFRFFPR